MIQNIKIDTIVALKPEMIFAYHFSGIENQLKNLSKSGTKMIYINEYMESSPLAYAEWIKLFGILFDRTEAAVEKFDEIKKQYLELSSRALNQIKKPSDYKHHC